VTDRLDRRLARSVVRRLRAGVDPKSPRSAGRQSADDDLTSVDGPRLVDGPSVRHDTALDGDPRVVVLVPHLALGRMSGGPNTIFHVTAPLVAAGIRLRYVATFGPLEPDEPAILRHIATLTGVTPAPGEIALTDASAPGSVIALGAGDVPLATWWPTAHVARSALSVVTASEFIYLIQDFEPAFHPWSTKYALAEATYRMPIRAIVNEPFLLDHLRHEVEGFAAVADQATVFLPAVDRTVFCPPAVERSGEVRRLAFYARPRTPRNLFEIGLRALRVAVAEGVFEGKAWEFVAIGQPMSELPLGGGAVLRPEPWLSYAAYGTFLATTDILLSPMLSPHTSYPPLEMAATGGRVVTTSFGPKSAASLAALSPLIHGVTPDVGAMVEGLRATAAAVAAAERAGHPREDGLAAPASWDDSLRDVVPWIVRTVAELRRDRVAP
jgi:hypothetical protein